MWPQILVLWMFGRLAWGMAMISAAPFAATAITTDHVLYLPLLFKPSIPGDGRLHNPSFEEGWTDLPPVSGNLINQQPDVWKLTWVEPGQPLYDSSDLAGGIPECVHKLNDQLPPDEQLGGAHALILDGDTTYKLFHATAAFAAELRQTIYGLPPGSHWQIVVPVQVHLHDDTDPYAAEAGVWVNGVGGWVNGVIMEDHVWYEHIIPFTVPQSGQAEIVIRVKSKWSRAKDFFIDYLRLQPAAS